MFSTIYWRLVEPDHPDLSRLIIQQNPVYFDADKYSVTSISKFLLILGSSSVEEHRPLEPNVAGSTPASPAS